MSLLFLWGVSLSGALVAEESVLRSWISGWFGFLLALVGKEQIFGYDRFTFGQMELVQGVSLIPVLMGIFGMAEVFDALSEPHPYIIPPKVGKIFPPFKVLIKYWKSIIRSSIQ